jgi:hypothetical protein
MLEKKICANFQIIIALFTQNIISKLSKILVWDPDPGSRGQKGTGSRIRNNSKNIKKTLVPLVSLCSTCQREKV